MFVPNYSKHRGWLRFFSGMMIGALIGWSFFIAEYGQKHDRLYSEIGKKDIIIQELQEKNAQFLNDLTLQNEENARQLIVQTVSVTILNAERYHLSQLNVYELRQQILKELQHLQGTNIETIASLTEVMESAVENKVYQLNDNQYSVKITRTYALPEFRIDVEIIDEEQRSNR
ncbi:sporulation membrane protein YtrI [Shouchella sp. 1P09AA]|uniref:sporulation membrane protein YtrI n=1 Tax=unclassified Shouchella TaxID=2893065 RepID=UPI0039A397B6